MTAAIATVTKMIESLPESAQSELVEHLREYIADLKDEKKWDNTFKRTQKKLITAARQAKKEIAAGKAEEMDLEKL